MKIKIQWQKLKETILDPKKPIWILITLALMGVTLMMFQQQTKPLNDQAKGDPPSLDTFVPAGFVLVTLQLINSDSIDSMVGAFCMVDLYSATHENGFSPSKSAMPIATHLRLIRAPNNPSLFGVLVPEEARTTIQQLAGPVFAVIQGPKAKTPVTRVQRKGRSIKYGELL